MAITITGDATPDDLEAMGFTRLRYGDVDVFDFGLHSGCFMCHWVDVMPVYYDAATNKIVFEGAPTNAELHAAVSYGLGG